MIKSLKLFDKFIDLEFTVEEPTTAVATAVPYLKNSTTTKKISFRTPKTGPKPNIAMYVNFLQGANNSDLTIKITNFYSEIDIQYYRYMKVVAGYMGSTPVTLGGEIWNCYVEKPNPEGVTIFQCVLGTISDLYNKTSEGPYDVQIMPDTVLTTLTKIAESLELKQEFSLPQAWLGVQYTDTESTETWSNALDMRTKVNKKLSDMAVALSLPHLYMSTTSSTFTVFALTEESVNDTTIILDKISTAYLMGGNIIVKAPWNPQLLVTGLFKMDTKFFRGRMASLQIGGEKKAFGIFEMKVAFSTHSENSMEINALDLSLTQGEF